MTTKLEIKAGDKVAVFTYWTKLPKASKVTLVTPTGKIRVEGYEEYLITPRECYLDGMPWTGQVNRGMRTVTVEPWTESHDQRIAADGQEREYRAKLSAIKQRVEALRVCETHSIDALCRLLDIE